jgi:hypothetical protein
MTKFYTVCYNEGTCGSFIASLLVLILSNSDNDLTFTEYGASDAIYGKYFSSKLDNSLYNSFRDVFKIRKKENNNDNFIIWKGVESRPDCDATTILQPDWHQLVITHEAEDFLMIRLLHWYKGNRTYYHRFYNNNKDKMSMSIDDAIGFDNVVKFLKEYISVMLSDRHAQFDQNVSSVWYEYYDQLPDEHKNRFTVIKFRDILSNPALTLEVLENMTGVCISQEVKLNYKRYLDAQKISFKKIFEHPELAPMVGELVL